MLPFIVALNPGNAVDIALTGVPSILLRPGPLLPHHPGTIQYWGYSSIGTENHSKRVGGHWSKLRWAGLMGMLQSPQIMTNNMSYQLLLMREMPNNTCCRARYPLKETSDNMVHPRRTRDPSREEVQLNDLRNMTANQNVMMEAYPLQLLFVPILE